MEVKRVCFDILRRERHIRGGLLDVCPVDSFAQGNILSDCAVLLNGFGFVREPLIYCRILLFLICLCLAFYII